MITTAMNIQIIKNDMATCWLMGQAVTRLPAVQTVEA